MRVRCLWAYVRWLVCLKATPSQGDMEDRNKLRAKAAAERALAKVQQEADKVAAEAENMARMGLSYDDIIKVCRFWSTLCHHASLGIYMGSTLINAELEGAGHSL